MRIFNCSGRNCRDSGTAGWSRDFVGDRVLQTEPLCSEEEARQWCEKVERAYEKLRMSLVYEGKPFMENIMMLAFDAAGGEYEMIEKRLGRCEGLVYCGD